MRLHAPTYADSWKRGPSSVRIGIDRGVCAAGDPVRRRFLLRRYAMRQRRIPIALRGGGASLCGVRREWGPTKYPDATTYACIGRLRAAVLLSLRRCLRIIAGLSCPKSYFPGRTRVAAEKLRLPT